MSSERRVRRLPLVVEQGLASTRIGRERLAESVTTRVGVDRITCHKGCNHCCYYPLTISLWEGVCLYRALKRAGRWRSDLKAGLERHAALTFGTSPEMWLMAGIPCPLLADGLCTAYAHRPFRCRSTLSTNDPDLCRNTLFREGTFADVQRDSVEFAALEAKLTKGSRDVARGLGDRVPLSVATLVGQEVDDGAIGLEQIPVTLARRLSRAL